MKGSLPLVLLSVASASLLSAQIAAPSPGFVRYEGLPIQNLYGIVGNLVTGQTAFGNAQRISFSDTAGLLVANGRIELVRVDGLVLGRYDYQGPLPILSIGRDLTSAIAWLPAEHSLIRWNGKAFASAAVDDSLPKPAISSAALIAPDVVRFLSTNADGSVSATTASLSNGNIVSSDILPGVVGPAFQFDNQLVWSDRSGLQLENAAGKRFSLRAPSGRFSAETMSSQWVHLYFPSDRSHWALHLSDTEPSLSRLPVSPTSELSK